MSTCNLQWPTVCHWRPGPSPLPICAARRSRREHRTLPKTVEVANADEVDVARDRQGSAPSGRGDASGVGPVPQPTGPGDGVGMRPRLGCVEVGPGVHGEPDRAIEDAKPATVEVSEVVPGAGGALRAVAEVADGEHPPVLELPVHRQTH